MGSGKLRAVVEKHSALDRELTHFENSRLNPLPAREFTLSPFAALRAVGSGGRTDSPPSPSKGRGLWSRGFLPGGIVLGVPQMPGGFLKVFD